MRFSNALTAEAEFIVGGIKHIVAKFRSVFWPDKARAGVKHRMAPATVRRLEHDK